MKNSKQNSLSSVEQCVLYTIETITNGTWMNKVLEDNRFSNNLPSNIMTILEQILF